MKSQSIALIAAISSIALTQFASAADLPRKAPPAPLPPPVYSWTGFYIGGNVGYSWGKVDVDTANVLFTDSLRPNGVIGGGQIGYNWQAAPNWVFGIEADFQGSGQKDSENFSGVLPIPAAAPITAAFSHEEKLEWFGTVRGRVGYAWDTVMLYATGGLAYGRVKSTVAGSVALGANPPTAFSFSESKTQTGWTAGAGIEGAVPNTRNWTWKVEYLYMDLGSIDHAFSDPTLGSGTISANFTDNIVRGGFNYRF